MRGVSFALGEKEWYGSHMSELLRTVVELVQARDVRVSAHGYDELAADGIAVQDVLSSIAGAELVREYRDHAKGPCTLVLQWDSNGRPLHVVWGIAKGTRQPVVLVTAYRPNPDIWERNWKTRKA